MKFRNCEKHDIDLVKNILSEENLPYSDIEKIVDCIFIVENEDGSLVGIAALETYGKVALLRSLVIKKSERNKSYGSLILTHIEKIGAKRRIEEIYLLTESAEMYFSHHGFEEILRNIVPAEIRNSSQFSSLCPSSAKVMRKYIV